MSPKTKTLQIQHQILVFPIRQILRILVEFLITLMDFINYTKILHVISLKDVLAGFLSFYKIFFKLIFFCKFYFYFFTINTINRKYVYLLNVVPEDD